MRIGLYETEAEAACAYNDMSVRLFGEDAYINDVEGYSVKQLSVSG